MNEKLVRIVLIEWILDLGVVFPHLNPQTEPEFLYHRNLNSTNQTCDFGIEMTLNDEQKSDPQLVLDKPLLQM